MVYLSNKELLAEMTFCLDSSIMATDKLIKMFQKMSERISYTISYNNSSDRKDLVSFGVMDAYVYWNRFNPEKSTNAFAYMTSVIRNGQLKGYRQMYPNRKNKIMEFSINNVWTI